MLIPRQLRERKAGYKPGFAFGWRLKPGDRNIWVEPDSETFEFHGDDKVITKTYTLTDLVAPEPQSYSVGLPGLDEKNQRAFEKIMAALKANPPVDEEGSEIPEEVVRASLVPGAVIEVPMAHIRSIQLDPDDTEEDLKPASVWEAYLKNRRDEPRFEEFFTRTEMRDLGLYTPRHRARVDPIGPNLVDLAVAVSDFLEGITEALFGGHGRHRG